MYPSIQRRRYMPDTLTTLSDDIVRYYKPGELLITSWTALRKRDDISRGSSCYFLREGWKVSRIYGADGNLSHYYCDIMEHVCEGGNLTYNDLLLDVVVYGDGRYDVLDMAELADAFAGGYISGGQLHTALVRCDALLELIRAGGFGGLTDHFALGGL